MADELTILTENAASDSWVDAIPSAVSTGYQAQNTNINANRNGIDSSYVRYDSGTDEIVVEVSGPIDDNGLPFAVGTEIRFANPGAGTWYLRVIPGTTTVDRSLEITASKGTWDGSKNGLYDSVPRRVLNWVIVNGDNGTNVSKMVFEPLNVIVGNADGESVDLTPLQLYPAPGVKSSFATPSTSIRGLAYDSSTGNLISSDTNTNLIYIHDGVSSSILSSFAAPSTNIRGITYDSSTGNLISSDSGTNLIYIHDGISASTLSSFATPGTSGGTRGLAYDSSTGNLVSGNISDDLIYIHTGITSSISSSFATPGVTTSIGHLTYDVSTGNLISSELGNENNIYVHSLITSSILLVFDTPDLSPGGITYNSADKVFISSDLITDLIYIHKRQLYYND